MFSEDDKDADLYQFWLYIPVPYNVIRAQLTGYLLVDDEKYNLTLTGTFQKTNVSSISKFTVYLIFQFISIVSVVQKVVLESGDF